MSNPWLATDSGKGGRIFKAVNMDRKLADKIEVALGKNQVERVLSKVDSHGSVKTLKLDSEGKIIGDWP